MLSWPILSAAMVMHTGISVQRKKGTRMYNYLEQTETLDTNWSTFHCKSATPGNLSTNLNGSWYWSSAITKRQVQTLFKFNYGHIPVKRWPINTFSHYHIESHKPLWSSALFGAKSVKDHAIEGEGKGLQLKRLYGHGVVWPVVSQDVWGFRYYSRMYGQIISPVVAV